MAIFKYEAIRQAVAGPMRVYGVVEAPDDGSAVLKLSTMPYTKIISVKEIQKGKVIELVANYEPLERKSEAEWIEKQ